MPSSWDPLAYRRIQLEGHHVELAADDGGWLFYVACYLGGGSSRIYSIDAFSATITGSVDLAGYAGDIYLLDADRYLIYPTTSE